MMLNMAGLGCRGQNRDEGDKEHAQHSVNLLGFENEIWQMNQVHQFDRGVGRIVSLVFFFASN